MVAVRGQKRSAITADYLISQEGRLSISTQFSEQAPPTSLWPRTADRRPETFLHSLRTFLQLPLVHLYPFTHMNTEAHMSEAARKSSAVPLCLSQANGGIAD
jgi:hypothetical protein